MIDMRRPRAVSGEIVTDGAAPADMRGRAPQLLCDVVDADYETVKSDGSARDGLRAGSPAGTEAAIGGLDMLWPGAEGVKARRGEPGGPLFWVTGIVLVVTAFWMSGGHALFDAASPSGRGMQVPAMRVASVQSRIETQGNRSLLFVDGEAVNDDEVVRAVPPISINVLDNEGRTTHYLLGTNDTRLEPGRHFSFSSRLIAPNAGVKSVSVTLREQDD